MSDLVLRHICKSFGSVEVLHGIDLEIADGEFVALVGPSGCGKSTMLRMIAGLEQITTGDVEIDGRWVNDLAPRQRNIAMVFQNYALYPHMSVRENISLNLKISGMKPAEVNRRVEEAARLLELEALMDRMPGQLSGGQRQRVAMGRAIVRDPAVFLFDEPLSNLDAKLRVQMRTEIKALHAKLGSTVVYVTHDQIEAMTLADRIVVLNAGRVEQVGRPLELYEKPANRFVAGFIGSPAMNFLDARIEKNGAEAVARFKDGSFFELGPRSDVTADQEVTVGVRPEHFSIKGQGSEMSGRLLYVEPTGSQTNIIIESGAGQVMASLNGIAEFKQQEELKLFVPPQAVKVFDRQSGTVLN
jgi:multiple sugar transport system ATP-binding protein